MVEPRPPIVTVLGHVDHGKTTLLDAIRKTNIASREAGGITQGIGASQISTSSGKITFVDTPGHAAFAKMRSRGAKIADIAILVVAADDGIMPQTAEALKYIKENEISLIVAFTKVDLPAANVEKARGQLEQEEIFFEGRGGQTPSVEIAAPSGKGVEELLETIELLAGVNEVTGDSDAELGAFVIETDKDKRGTMVSVVVKNGKLKTGDEITTGQVATKVKGLFDESGKPVKEALPGDPVAILGFTDVPEVGAEVVHGSAKNTSQGQSAKQEKVGDEQLGLVVKTQSLGSLEAIVASLPKDAIVLSKGVGEVSDSDVFFAKTSGAVIVSFETKIGNSVKRLADTEGVEIADFKIIYELVEYVEKKIEEGKMKIFGKAEILAEFPFNKTRVAGCKILEGRMAKGDKIVVMRGEKELGSSKISSMRREKNEISEARAGEECGIVMSPLSAFEKGDILVATK
jgi:translation initiation factor IF-2